MDENNDKPEAILQFHQMELDDRLLKAIAKLGWEVPTLIQEKAIPLVLEGKDVLIRARTGSGKTAAFAIPLIQILLTHKQTAQHQEVKALLLAPSKELCNQICSVIKELTTHCSRDIKCIDISQDVSFDTQKPLLIEKPDIVVSTPATVLKHLRAGNLDIKESLELLIIDEADLIFSFGYEEEVNKIMHFLPIIYQAILASATLSNDVKSLKSLVLYNPAILKLEEPDLAPTSQLSHYLLMAEEIDKATILYALLKLHLIRGKSLVFVNTVDKCYKLKLYLEQFGIRICVLNSELPATIRCHSVNQFNQGVYDIIIASDEKVLDEPGFFRKDSKGKSKTKRIKDKESGVSRGIDFQCVSNVINFDFPLDVCAYVHRAGRTARGNNKGSVLSFVSVDEKQLLDKVDDYLKTVHSETTGVFMKYQFKLEEVAAFKYRARDAWKAATRIAVREARLKEIKMAVLNCQQLKSYFDDNPNDLKVLRHDKALHTVRVQPHLADVPEYIVPPTLKNLAGITKKGKRKYQPKSKDTFDKHEMKHRDPLFSMKFEGFKKKKQN